MRDAKQLTVCDVCGTALAPCRNVVGVHFVESIDLVLVRVVTDRAVRTVGLALSAACFCLA